MHVYDMSNIELVIQHVSCAPGWGLRSKKGRPRKGSKSSKVAPVLTAGVCVCVCVCVCVPCAFMYIDRHSYCCLSAVHKPDQCRYTESIRMDARGSWVYVQSKETQWAGLMRVTVFGEPVPLVLPVTL